MSATVYYYRASMPWTVQVEDRWFRRILLTVCVLALLFSALVALFPVPPHQREEITVPPRLAKLIMQEKVQPPPPPPPVEEPAPPEPAPLPEPAQKKPVEKRTPEPVEVVPEQAPVPAPVPQPSARERAARAGLLAMRDELADLRSADNVVSHLEKQSLRQGAGNAPSTPGGSERSIITSQATTGSGGINTSRLSRDTGGSQLAARETTRVIAPDDAAKGGARAEQDATGKKPGMSSARSSEDIQVVFDRNKGTLNAIYNRALRLNPTLAGKVVLKLTIAPSGTVTQCEIVSSELNDPDLEHKLVARVQLFDFGVQDAAVTTITYPIDFFPG